jgi:hypothetical protein
LNLAAIFLDIIQAGWNCYRAEEKIHMYLMEAVFKVEKIIYDDQSIFPTALAKKLINIL